MAVKVTARITGNALNGFARSLKQLSVDGKAQLKAAVELTAQEVADDARRRVPVSDTGPKSRKAKDRPGPGELRKTIRWEPSTTDAPVAYVKAGEGKLRRRSRAKTAKGKARAKRVRSPVKFEDFSFGRDESVFFQKASRAKAYGVYAMAVEYGAPHRGVAARPYLRPATRAKRSVLIARATEALRAAARQAGGS